MAIAFRSVGQVGGAVTGSVVTVPAPAGIQDNDALVAVIMANTNTDITSPGGTWTQVLNQLQPGGSNLRSAVFVKRAASESGSYSFGISAGASFGTGIVAAYSGVNTTTLLDATSAQAGPTSATNIDAPTITTATANAVLVALYAGQYSGSWSQPTGMTERADQNDGVLSTVALDDQVIAAAGATGVRNSSKGAGSAALTAWQIALKPAALAPSAPTLGTITPGNAQLSAAFTAGSDGGSAITTYKYSTDNGATYLTRQTGTTASPIVITTLSSDGTTPLSNGTSYTVLIKAVNAVGDGTASNSVAATPSTTPDAPTALVATGGNQQVSVAFTAGATGGSALTSYKYSTDNGSSYRTRQTGTTASPLLITTLSSDGTTPLSNGVTYQIRLKAVNANGDGTASGAVAGTPVAPVATNLDAAFTMRVGGL